MTAKVRLSLALALVVVIAGCGGPKRAPMAMLTGKITYKDQKITLGDITFHPTSGDGSPQAGQILSDGIYEVSDLPPGEYKVTVNADRYDPAKKPPPPRGARDKQQYKMSPRGKGWEDKGESTGTFVAIPRKYADKEKTDLKVNVKAGKNSEDLKLTD
jgi:hypothetical protein